MIHTSNHWPCEEYNVCNDEFLTVNSLINIIKDELDIKEYSVEYNSSEAILPPNNYGVFKNDKVKTSYNIKFKNLKESLTEYIKWYNKN